jgi:hypothetical protein
MDLLREKISPLNFPQQAIDIIKLLTVENGTVELLGSQALSSQLYAADYDLFQKVAGHYKRDSVALVQFVLRFQRVIEHLMAHSGCFIGDIKAGLIPQWRVVEGEIRGGKVVGYDASTSRVRLRALVSAGVLSDEEYTRLRPLLIEKPTVAQWVKLRTAFRFEVIRWKPKDILRGHVVLRNGERYTLEEAFVVPAPIKIDVVALVGQRYTDFSCIYEFSNRGTVFNAVESDPLEDIQQSLAEYVAEGNYFKAAKRAFSIAKMRGDYDILMKLHVILNSDLGALYSLSADIGTLLFLLENAGSAVSPYRIRAELAGFRVRLGTIYSVDVNDLPTLAEIAELEDMPATAEGREELEKGLTSLQHLFDRVLSNAAYKRLCELGLIPLPYMP